jgi:hypothetical protein
MRHPEIEVQLIGTNGNAFALLGKISKALRAAEVPKAEIDEFLGEAMSVDYDHVLRTCMDWVNVT